MAIVWNVIDDSLYLNLMEQFSNLFRNTSREIQSFDRSRESIIQHWIVSIGQHCRIDFGQFLFEWSTVFWWIFWFFFSDLIKKRHTGFNMTMWQAQSDLIIYAIQWHWINAHRIWTETFNNHFKRFIKPCCWPFLFERYSLMAFLMILLCYNLWIIP